MRQSVFDRFSAPRRSPVAALFAMTALAGCAVAEDLPVAAPAEAPAAETTWSSGSFVWMAADGFYSPMWYRSGYTLTTPVHEVAWSPSQVGVSPDGVSLSIDTVKTEGENGPAIAYRSGELVSTTQRGHGRYEVVMRPARGAGLVSTFFLYSGADAGDIHNEINLNFPGKDTTTIEMSYLVDGVRVPGAKHDLGFDAADEFHLYAFEYAETGIKWFVGDQLVYETAADAPPPPVGDMPLVANLWAASPSQYAWTGAPEFDEGASATYRCVSFVAEGEDSPSCSSLIAD